MATKEYGILIYEWGWGFHRIYFHTKDGVKNFPEKKDSYEKVAYILGLLNQEGWNVATSTYGLIGPSWTYSWTLEREQ